MIRHRRLQQLLHDYVAGDLDEAQRRDVEQRIENDPRVRALHDEIAEAHAALTILKDRPQPPVSASDALSRIQVAITRQRFERRPELYLDGSGRRYYRRIAMAATLLLAVTVGLLVTRGGDPIAPTHDITAPLDTPRPSADVRGLVDAASAGPLDALTVLEILEKAGKLVLEFTPNDGVLPVAEGQRR